MKHLVTPFFEPSVSDFQATALTFGDKLETKR